MGGSNDSRTNILNKLKALQQSQTDYADMVEESGMEGAGTGMKIPASIGTKPLKLEPGMHHMEQLDLSHDSMDEDIKEAD